MKWQVPLARLIYTAVASIKVYNNALIERISVLRQNFVEIPGLIELPGNNSLRYLDNLLSQNSYLAEIT